MLAQRLPSILPPLRPHEALEVSLIHSAAGLLEAAGVVQARPFRAPHHTVTVAGLAGPYTYSDMTGGALNNVTCNPAG